jgi:carboxymethylenebutenolidase
MLTATGMLMTPALQAQQDPAPPTAYALRKPPVAFSPTNAPKGAETLAVNWVETEVPGKGGVLAAIARPQGAGPFPSVILLHGTHGFAQQYVQLAQELARERLIAVAACWVSGGSGAGSRFITPIACPKAPPMPDHGSPESLQVVGALVQAVRTMPDVRADRIALFGHSRGSGAALSYIQGTGDVQAAVLNSGGYPSEWADRASRVRAPILILHGIEDSPADGGGAPTNVRMARAFEAALRRAGKPVEAMYYEGGRHNLFSDPAQHDDEVRRSVIFLRRHLRD